MLAAQSKSSPESTPANAQQPLNEQNKGNQKNILGEDEYGPWMVVKRSTRARPPRIDNDAEAVAKHGTIEKGVRKSQPATTNSRFSALAEVGEETDISVNHQNNTRTATSDAEGKKKTRDDTKKGKAVKVAQSGETNLETHDYFRIWGYLK